MADVDPIKLAVITPERVVLEDRTNFVAFTAHDGDMGFLHNRAPLMCELGIGQLRYRSASQTHRLFVDGGFAQVGHDVITVLTPRAIRVEDITRETVRQAEGVVGEITGKDQESLEARRLAQQRVRVLRRMQPPAVPETVRPA